MMRYFAKNTHAVFFLKRFGYLLKRNIPAKEALIIIHSDTTDKEFKRVIFEIIDSVNQGKSLSESFKNHPHYFSQTCLAMIQTGEKIGSLDEILLKFADFLDRRIQFYKKLLSSLIYPLLIFLVFAFSFIFLINFVFPKVTDLFLESSMTLPLITRLVLSTVSLLRTYGLILLLLISIVVCLVFKYAQNNHFFLDELVLKIPVLKELMLKIELFNFTSSLQLMVSGGYDFLDGFNLATSFIKNKYLKEKLENIYLQSIKGNDLSSCLAKTKIFPSFFIAIITAAIKDGGVEESLNYLSQTYEKDIEIQTETIVKLLEPLIIISLGILIGIFIIAILLPLLDLNQIAT